MERFLLKKFFTKEKQTIMTKLSQHFTEEEFLRSETASRYRIDNSFKSITFKQNAIKLCKEVLEPIRTHLNKPVFITSGYRCQALNKKVNGSKTSAHMYGLAVDFIVYEMSVKEAFLSVSEFLTNSKIPFDQLILEYGSWIHLGLSMNENRNQILKIGGNK